MKFEKLILFFFVFLGEFILPKFLLAQVIPDDTLGAESSTVNSIDELRDVIEGGAIRGNNLFHSFQEFNVGEGANVNFSNPEGIVNIFSRVTGNDVSDILGTLGVDGNANLFLMNPSGIIFGENARLDIGGSFLATTAETINFPSGNFSTNDSEQSSISINFPIGLGFGNNPGSITVQGKQNNLVLRYPSLTVDTSKFPPGIQVAPNQNISLIGGKINFNGGGLQTFGGNIELVSISGNQNLDFVNADNWLNTNISNNKFQDITFKNAAYIDSSGEIAGDINISGRRIEIDEGSAILANTSRFTTNSINIDASEAITIKGSSGEFNSDKSLDEIEKISTGQLPEENIDNYYSVSLVVANNIFSDLETLENNRISINTKKLEILDAGQIRTTEFLTENRTAGDIAINAQDIIVSGTNHIDSLVSSSITGGNIKISSQSLEVTDGGRIVSDSFDGKSSGNLFIESDNIVLKGYPDPFVSLFTGLFTNPLRTNTQGNINIITKTLNVLDGAKINTNSAYNNSAGNIDIDAEESITVSGFIPFDPFISSAIASSVDIRSAVNVEQIIQNNSDLAEAGKINIHTNQLKILNGARIESINNLGNSGIINIDAQDIELNGTRPKVFNFIGGISTSTRETSVGYGGNININTSFLRVLNGSIIRAISLGSGNAGNIDINAKTIEISGVDHFAPKPVSSLRVSKISTGAQFNNGGNLSMDSDFLVVKNQSQIESSSNGDGVGGQSFINSKFIILQNQGNIVANTSDGTGGNITINSDSILGINNSDITANAIGGNGGNITIDADYIIGLKERSQLTSGSDITVSSEFGFAGSININPDAFLDEDLAILAAKEVRFDSSKQSIQQACLISNRDQTGNMGVLVGTGNVESSRNYFDRPEDAPHTPLSSKTSGLIWLPNQPIEEADSVVRTKDGQTLLVNQKKLQDLETQLCYQERTKTSDDTRTELPAANP
jgi:filamentous hemagglutinin family protein